MTRAFHFITVVAVADAFTCSGVQKSRRTCILPTRRAPFILPTRLLSSLNTNETWVDDVVNDTGATGIVETHLMVQEEIADDDDSIVAKTLDGRLLCASQCAYNPVPPYFEAAGYLPETTTIRITKSVNSVLLGETCDGLVLAFRGTVTVSPLDWLQNAALRLQRVPNLPGRLHSGFYRAVTSIWKPMKSNILEAMQSNNNTIKIFMTGHSKGGAMASIAAMLVNQDEELPNVTEVVTFASAKAGDSKFAKAFYKQVNQTSYEYYLDIVPFLPPSQAVMNAMDEEATDMMDGVLWDNTTKSQAKEYIWDYQPVGVRKYIDGNISVTANVTRELDDLRIKDIEQKTLLSLREFAAAHCLACPRMDGKCKGGYFAAVAREVCECCSDW